MRVGVCLAIVVAFMAPVRVFASEAPTLVVAPDVGSTATQDSAVCQDSYRICPGDTLYVSVDGEELFTRECQVNGAGSISYPLLGDVPAAGTSCTALKTQLEDGLKRYLKNPRVMVTVRQYGQVGMSVFVMGEVKSPGVYPLASGSGLMQPLAAAGGLTEFASGELTIMKARTGASQPILLDQVANNGAEALLEPGDVILVQRKREARYAVLGEVPSPGMFDMPVRGEVRILDAITSAGLLAQNQDTQTGVKRSLMDDPARISDLEHAVITRGQTTIPVDLTALLRGDTNQNLALQPGDILTIPRRPSVRVYALGEFRIAGRLNLPDGAVVLDLLNAAGGTTQNAQPSDASLLRIVEGKPTSLPVDVGRLLSKGDLSQNVTLKEGDVLYVPARGESNQSAWRLLSILPLVF